MRGLDHGPIIGAYQAADAHCLQGLWVQTDAARRACYVELEQHREINPPFFTEIEEYSAARFADFQNTPFDQLEPADRSAAMTAKRRSADGPMPRWRAICSILSISGARARLSGSVRTRTKPASSNASYSYAQSTET